MPLYGEETAETIRFTRQPPNSEICFPHKTRKLLENSRDSKVLFTFYSEVRTSHFS